MLWLKIDVNGNECGDVDSDNLDESDSIGRKSIILSNSQRFKFNIIGLNQQYVLNLVKNMVNDDGIKEMRVDNTKASEWEIRLPFNDALTKYKTLYSHMLEMDFAVTLKNNNDMLCYRTYPDRINFMVLHLRFNEDDHGVDDSVLFLFKYLKSDIAVDNILRTIFNQ
jgi:hypothetical protein